MPSIRHEVLIGAPVDEVYKALTTADGLAAWWTPDVTARPEPGSIARFGFGPGNFKEMCVTDLVPHERVKWVCLEGAEEWKSTAITFDLRAGDRQKLLAARPEIGDQIRQAETRNGATLLSFRHDGWRDDTPMLAECSYTWARFLASLKAFCEGGAGWPWPRQHRLEERHAAA